MHGLLEVEQRVNNATPTTTTKLVLSTTLATLNLTYFELRRARQDTTVRALQAREHS
eukprot:COSAG02_NODE_2790_length_8022_cov_52.613783_7_plen_57_part_00